jgi:catechol 2,3-dioxygenase-like lactoylglutathione lyase family enzyme
MAKKFHVAVFCSDATYLERRAFYTAIFGAPSWEGPINEGSDGHSYDGSIWQQQGICFALLKEPTMTGAVEKLAHVGLIFETGAEFDAEIQRRSIDKQRIETVQAGQRQVFVRDENSTEWEFSCSETITP